MSDAGLRIAGVERRFVQGERRLDVLRGASLAVGAGETVSLVGPSGSGKSTLLHIAGLLERADAGEVEIGGRACGGLNDRERTAIRRGALGFVYQFHHLLPEFTAEENVMLPQMVARRRRTEASARARRLLERVGLANRRDHRPGQLSGGEQQRVAVVRALANRPRVLLADEPTGNLDPATSERVFGELLRLAQEDGLAVLVATHNSDIARRADRMATLREGRIVPGDAP